GPVGAECFGEQQVKRRGERRCEFHRENSVGGGREVNLGSLTDGVSLIDTFVEKPTTKRRTTRSGVFSRISATGWSPRPEKPLGLIPDSSRAKNTSLPRL